MVLSGVESDEPKLDTPGPVNYKREDYIEEDGNLSDTDSEDEWEKPRLAGQTLSGSEEVGPQESSLNRT